MPLEDYYISFVNLDHRTDRLNHMEGQLHKVGIKAVRTRGILPHEYRGTQNVNAMKYRTPGAIGCHFSQVSIMERAMEEGKHAWVMEDDIIFCSDFDKRFDHIENFCATHEWDVIWLGAAFHVNPPHWHKTGKSSMPPDCSAQLGYDAKRTDDSRMIRTFGAYNTFAYIVNKDSIDKILRLFNKNIHISIGIDWLFIKLQPQLNCFSYVPGCIKQMDNKSDIGKGMTIWSGHLKNGPYVWQDKLTDFNPDNFNWHEAN